MRTVESQSVEHRQGLNISAWFMRAPFAFILLCLLVLAVACSAPAGQPAAGGGGAAAAGGAAAGGAGRGRGGRGAAINDQTATLQRTSIPRQGGHSTAL